MHDTEQVEKIIRERLAAAGKPYCNPAPYRRLKPDSDDVDGDGGAAGRAGMAYEVTIKYRVD